MDFRNSSQRNLVKSLFLNAEELEANNRILKAKYDQMKREEIRYESYNLEKDYRALIVSFGTMSRVCRTAVDMMKADGFEVGMLRPQTLFPFPEKAVRDAAGSAAGRESCKVVVSIELSMGQMVEDVERSVQGKCPVEWYGRAGGDIPTPEEIIDVVRTLVKN